MKKKIVLHKKLSLHKETIGNLNSEQQILIADGLLANLKGGRVTTILRTCNPGTLDSCLVCSSICTN
jgi:hypothetical protein